MRTALIDADIVAYQVAAAAEEPTPFDDDIWVLWADAGEAKRASAEALDHLYELTESSDIVLCFSDKDNFRKDILPTYKGNRAATRKPMVLSAVREYMMAHHRSVVLPRLEGDDVIGILATSDDIVSGEKVIVSLDKDLRQIPGLHLIDEEITEITEAEADRWHMTQTLEGDRTDNYSGCPGVGRKTADKILDNAGDNMWAAVVAAYEKAKLSEREALVQAQVARICRATDYDNEKGSAVPWFPMNPMKNI